MPLTDDPAARETYERMQVVSLVCAPLVRGGRLVAALVMSGGEPRRWSHDESDLLEQVAERTLFAVESARAAQALREHRDVMQLAMSTAQMGAWSRDLVLDTVWWSPEFAELFGMSPDDTNYSRDRLFEQVRPDDRARLQDDHREGARRASGLRHRFRVPACAHRRMAVDGGARPRRILRPTAGR